MVRSTLKQKPLVYSLGLIILFLISSISSLKAQEIKVHLSSKTVVVGERFNVAYLLTDKEGIEVSNELEAEGLECLYGPTKHKSSSVFSDNGHVTSSTTEVYTYVFLADKEGTYTIKGFKVKTNKEELTAPEVRIKVLKPTSVEQKEIKRLPMLRAIVPKKKIYINEALPICYKLYSEHLNIIPSRFNQEVKYDGAVVQDIPINKDENIIDKERYNNVVYNVIPLHRQIIFPQKAGILKVNPINYSLSVRVPSGDFFYDERDIYIKSKAQNIQVLPLPSKGKSSDFSGAVGSFTISQACDTSNGFKSDQAYNLKITIQGAGNLKTASIPKLNFPLEFEVYPPKSEKFISFNSEDNSISSKLEIEYNFIPRVVGQFNLEGIKFNFFNPKSKQYETIETEGLSINVKQGKKRKDYDIIQEVSYSDNILSQYDKSSPTKHFKSEAISSMTYWMSYLLIIILTLLSIFYLLHYRKERDDYISFNAKRAKKIAIKQLKQAQDYLLEQKDDDFYNEMLQSLWKYIANKFSLPPAMLSREQIQGLFKEHQLSEQLAQDYCHLIDQLEEARYSPVKEKDGLEELYQQAIRLISMIETNK